MSDSSTTVRHLEAVGFTHVVWIPDTTLGPWEADLTASTKLKLIRPCREGEVIGVCAGLILGGARPLAVMQCTGLFEAGDALRNVVHDLGLPLKLLVGVRSYAAYQAGQSKDNCPVFTEPILTAWKVPFELIAHDDAATFGPAVRSLAASPQARAVLLGE